MGERDLSGLRIDPADRQRRRPAWVVPLVVAAAVLLVAALSLPLLRGAVRPEVSVAEVKAAPGGPAAVLNASGYVTPRRRATVAAKITGKLVTVEVEEGDLVREGQVLARLDDLDAVTELATTEAEHKVAQARIRQAEVELEDAQRTLRRIEGLHGKGVASQEDFDLAVTRADVADAALTVARREVDTASRRVAMARRGVENCVVRAPFAGVAVSKDAQPGEMVSPISAGGGFTRTGIATVVDMASLEIEVDVNEAYIARVRPGQPVEAVLDAYPDWKIPASVITVIPTADRQKATVKVRIRFSELDPRILPDMGVRVSFLEEKQADAAVPTALVPRAAVREDAGQHVVFVLNDEVVERRTVRVGETRGEELEVLAGLHGGERVVVAGGERLRDGQQVRVK